ncbi:MAG TPA: hypothetical protein VGX96_16835 [Candidatus Elarobacter sp.]|jgi:hypothetical protein|nr:hypothetical protein [Candidatus Elarobacter sp.]
MRLPPDRSPAPAAYRFVTRVTGHGLPALDKTLRLRCTISAADHSVVGVSALVVRLGTATDCERALELVHEPPAHDAPPPRYFELIASLAPAAEPAKKLRGAFAAAGTPSDATELRIAGMMDPASSRVVLPKIALRGN